MRIVFFDLPSKMAFNVATPESQPLGGMASCVCYLAHALAVRGHDVTLVALLPEGTPPVLMRVRHVSIKEALTDPISFFRDGAYDAVIAVNYPDIAPYVKNASPKTLCVAWLHIYPDQPALASLTSLEGWIDAAVCVSATLRDAFHLSIPTVAIGNAIAPSFENMFSSPEELLAAKQNRAVYASMPFRGLDLLVEVMGEAKGTFELDVYSAMRTYQAEEESFTALYEAARRNPRIRYHGAVGQRELAGAFRGAAFLAYPSTFIESFCIVAQEAIAAGLKVISNDLGALPETTMGFADLLPMQGGALSRADHVAGFTRLLEQNDAAFQRDPKAWARDRFTQSQAVNRESTWTNRAQQWEAFLTPAVEKAKADTSAKPKNLTVGGVTMPASLERAVLMQRMGNHAEAERACAEALRGDPDNAIAHHFLGFLLMQQGRHAEAVKHHERAIALKPDYAEPHYNRAIALCNVRRFEEALAGFDAALAIQPAYVDALAARGAILHVLNRSEEALQTYDAALVLQPSAELFYNRANVFMSLSRFADAIISLDRAIALKADFADAWNNRAALLLGLNHLDEALSSVERAIALRPDLAAARENRTAILRRLGRL